MKQMDETMLLRAIGNVGDDLLERAERSAGKRRHYGRWGVLAACLCLALALTYMAPMVLESFSMGSAGNTSAAPEFSDSAAPENGANPEEASDAAGGENAVGGNTEPGGFSAGDYLRQWGLAGESDLLSVAVSGEESAHREEKGIDGAGFYEALQSAQILTAPEDVQTFAPSLTITLSLTDGTELQGAYDPEEHLLLLGGYYFYNEAFAQILERSGSE